ncbi:MAG: ATP synthase subunit C [Candidatus Kariarchaeaceae archaeon]
MKVKQIRKSSIITLFLVSLSLLTVNQYVLADTDNQSEQPILAGDNPSDIFPVAEEPDIDYSNATVIVEHKTIEDEGMKKIAAGLAIGLAGLGAAIGMGQAGSAAIGAISEKPELFGKALIFVVFIEAVAIYGLLISILIVFNI